MWLLLSATVVQTSLKRPELPDSSLNAEACKHFQVDKNKLNYEPLIEHIIT